MLVITTTAIGVVASVAGLIAFFSPNYGRLLIGRLRRVPTYDWLSVPHVISTAKHRVFILQTWLPALRMELPAWRKALAREGVDFRVLLADQKLVPFRLRSREPVSSLLIQNVADVCEFLETTRGKRLSNPQVRFYSTLPFGPIYIIDDVVHWGLYLSHGDSMEGPVFREQADSRLGKEILNSFQSIWNDANERTGLLSVSAPLSRTRVNHAQEEVEFSRKAEVLSQKVSRSTESDGASASLRKGYLCVLRHADTDLNGAEIITGSLDVGINAAGRARLRRQAEVFERERWSSVYSSPARRCTETLTELLKGDSSEIQMRDELRERSMGELEGFSKAGYQQSLPEYQGVDLLSSFHASSASGESYCEVFHRISNFVEHLVEDVLKGDRILVCTHDTVIRMIVLLLENTKIQEAITLNVNNGEAIYYAPALRAIG